MVQQVKLLGQVEEAAAKMDPVAFLDCALRAGSQGTRRPIAQPKQKSAQARGRRKVEAGKCRSHNDDETADLARDPDLVAGLAWGTQLFGLS